MVSGSSSRLGRRGEDPDAEETLADDRGYTSIADLKEAREAVARATREAEQAKLELLEMQSELRDEKKRSRSLHAEVQDLKRGAAASRLDEASVLDERQAEHEKHTAEIERLNGALEQATNDLANASEGQSELESAISINRAEFERLKTKNETSEQEKAQLAALVEQLKGAGRALHDLMEERVANSEAQRLEAEDALRSTKEQLYEARQLASKNESVSVSRGGASQTASAADAMLAASLSAGMASEQKESATAIDNENLKLDLDHARNRLHDLEEQLEDARGQLEAEVSKEKRKRQESGELIEKLKKDIKGLKEAAALATAEKDRLIRRADELEVALRENRATLETERAELEVLRNETGNTPTASKFGEQAEKEKEKDRELSRLREAVESLNEELRLMEEINDHGNDDVPSKARNKRKHTSMEQLITQYQRELKEKEAEIWHLQKQLSSTSLAENTVSFEPTNTDLPPLLVSSSSSSLRSGQHLSPSHAPTGQDPPSSTSLSPQGTSKLSKKRDSNASIRSTSSSGRRSIKDDQSMQKDEIGGLKFLVKELSAERSDLLEQNQRLIEEARALK